jgi:acyl-CoA synthetase (AMP-forming)/AMP-acid ligase II
VKSSAHHVVRHLQATVAAYPDQEALVYQAPGGFSSMTYTEVEERSNAYAQGFLAAGIRPGTKTILMVRSSPELFLICFALMKIDAIAVIVDPGMGVRRMLRCFRSVGAEAFIGIPIAHLVRLAFPRTFSTIRTSITVGPRLLWRGVTLQGLATQDEHPLTLSHVQPDDLVMINFTTGSTGPAKGVEYTHQMLDAMLHQVRETYSTQPQTSGLVTLPMFALFDLMVGCRTVLAPMDPTRPAQVNPQKIGDAIERFKVCHMFASPALLHRIAPYGQQHPKQFSSLRVVACGGAAAPLSVLDAFRNVLPAEATLHSTYGATEALPMASITYRELTENSQPGACLGLPNPGLRMEIIALDAGVLDTWTESLCLPPGEIGEIAVQGALASTHYHRAPAHNRTLKIPDPSGVWHRTGDLGWFDAHGRVWFAGRKSQRVRTPTGPRFTVPCEQVFNQHSDVYRSALVGHGAKGQQHPVMCVELAAPLGRRPRQELCVALRAMADEHEYTRGIQDILFHPKFPVDIRHNAKINRELLTRWAQRRLTPSRKGQLLKLFPLTSWVYLGVGLVWPFSSPLLTAAWWIIVFLNFAVHAAQLPAAFEAGRGAGHTRPKVAFFTILLGATYWKFLLAPLPAAEEV